MICENCGKEHDGKYASGRFCCKSCSIAFGNKKKAKNPEKNKKISESVKRYYIEHPEVLQYKKHNKPDYTYICEKCGDTFKTKYKIKNGRYIHCENCKRKVVHYKDINKLTSIKELSKRTITKLLVRANKECSLCGWNESTKDIHHIIPRSKGGTDDGSNLIIVCPNCHRVIHTTDKYSEEYLKQFSIENTFNNWKDYYHPCN